MKKLVSIVISAYNEAENVDELHCRLSGVLDDMRMVDFEILFVNDGSTDGTLECIRALSAVDHRIKIVDLLRNFGHEIAMTAGLDHAEGDAVILMDADLQHPPSVVPQLVAEWLAGKDVVLTERRDNRGQSWPRKMLARGYYRILNLLSNVPIPANSPDFRLIDRKYVNILKQMRECDRMFRGMLNWICPDNYATVRFTAPERFAGATKYTLRASLKLAFDGIFQFSIRPLRAATYLGLAAATLSGMLFVYTIVGYLLYDYPHTGYATLVIAIIFLGSVQLLSLGIIGEYIGRMHLEVKKRPLYFAEFITHDEQTASASVEDGDESS